MKEKGARGRKMMRNFKILGLTALAILVFSTTFSSTASAQGKLTSDGPVTLLGAETGVGANSGTVFGSKTECPGSTSVGHKLGSTTELIPSGATTITTTPLIHQGNCAAWVSGSKYPMTVTDNGCDSVVHIGSTVSANTYTGTVDVVCPAGKVIEEHVFCPGCAHTAGNKVCQLNIAPQTGLAGAQVISTPASDDLDLVGTMKNIHTQRSGLCTLDGKGTTTTTGETHIDATVQGINKSGEPTGVTITD